MPKAKKVSASPKVTRKCGNCGEAGHTKKTCGKLGNKINAGYFLEVHVNDEKYRGDAGSLTQALHDFTLSPAFPFAVKTRVVIKYGTENVEKQRVLHVPAARRLFHLISTKPSALEMWGNKFESNLSN